MSGNVDCFKLLPRNKRATEAWKLHSSSIMHREKAVSKCIRMEGKRREETGGRGSKERGGGAHCPEHGMIM